MSGLAVSTLGVVAGTLIGLLIIYLTPEGNGRQKR
jgi:hypothetical protein